LDDTSVSGNTALNDGGGIANAPGATLPLTKSLVTGNYTASDGGGITNGGPMTLAQGDVTTNIAVQNGGGIVNKWGAIHRLLEVDPWLATLINCPPSVLARCSPT